MATCSASASRSKPSGWIGGGTAGRGGGTVGSDGCLAALVARLAAAAGGLNRPDEKTGSELELVSATEGKVDLTARVVEPCPLSRATVSRPSSPLLCGNFSSACVPSLLQATRLRACRSCLSCAADAAAAAAAFEPMTSPRNCPGGGQVDR